MNGNKRKPGRPRKPPTVIVTMRLSKAQHAAYIERGGARWAKRMIDELINVQAPISSHIFHRRQSSNVHRTVAKSMAPIEAVDDFFERAIQQLGEATAAERAAMQSLSQLFETFVGLAPGNDKSNALVLHALRQQIAPDLHSQIEAMLRAKPFILDNIRARYGSVHAFRQPWILFAYLQVDRQPNQTQDSWPLTQSEINPIYTDLGKRMT